jgi:hypothetical protein
VSLKLLFIDFPSIGIISISFFMYFLNNLRRLYLFIFLPLVIFIINIIHYYNALNQPIVFEDSLGVANI